jgi:probable phosphoglycerate mutase
VPIYLIRHGETAHNAARVLQHPETPLSERGLAQAERLARRLAGAGIGLVLASDYERALRTADVLARATGAPVVSDALLQERDFGALRGRPYGELGFDPFAADYEPPGGESWPVFLERVARAWQRVREAAAQAPGSLAVVTHGLVCGALVRHHLTLAEGAARPAGFGNTAVTEIESAPPWRVRLLACTAHLEGEAGESEPGRPTGGSA